MPICKKQVLANGYQSLQYWPYKKQGADPVQSRLRTWQQARTWARLIKEAESLWHVEVRALRRIGELELSQLLEEVPPNQRSRVNRWLKGYFVSTRLYKNKKLDKI